MQLISLPENYTGALSPVIYKVAPDAKEHILEVALLEQDRARIAAVKRFKGEDMYSINVAPYMRRRITIEPLAEDIGFVHIPDRSCISTIRIGEHTSEDRIITGGTASCPEKEILSNSPFRLRIAPGECDEIAFTAPGSSVAAKAILVDEYGSSTEIYLGNIECGDGIYVLSVNADSINAGSGGLESFREMSIEIKDEENVFISRNYEITPADDTGIRICWQNPYGQIDYYTFENVAEEYLATEKNRIYSSDGYSVISAYSESFRTLVSECETEAAIKWIAEIVTSPQVWIRSRNGLERIDIISDEITLKEQKPVSLKITARNSIRKTHQK